MHICTKKTSFRIVSDPDCGHPYKYKTAYQIHIQPKKALCIVSAIVTVDAYINKKTKTQRVTYIFIYKKTSA